MFTVKGKRPVAAVGIRTLVHGDKDGTSETNRVQTQVVEHVDGEIQTEQGLKMSDGRH